MRRVAILGTALVLGLLPCPAARGGQPGQVTLDAWAREADLIVAARPLESGVGWSRMEVIATLKGEAGSTVLRVAPLDSRSCVEQTPFRGVAEAILFLGPRNGEARPCLAQGQAWLTVYVPRRESMLAAVRRVVEIAAIKDPAARLDAYFAAVESESPELRRWTSGILGILLEEPAVFERNEARAMALFSSAFPEAKRAVVLAAVRLKTARAVPALGKSLEDEDSAVWTGASQALGRIDSEESLAILLGAAEKPGLGGRAAVGLRASRRPEARAALVALLSSEEAHARASAVGAFRDAHLQGEDAWRILLRLLKDPDRGVRAQVLDVLTECPLPETTAAVLSLLRGEGVDPGDEMGSISCLRMLAGEGGPRPGSEAVRKELRAAEDLPVLLRRILDADRPAAGGVVRLLETMATPAAMEVLRFTARSGATPALQDAARKALDRLASR